MAKYCNCEKFYKVKDFEDGATVRFKELPIAFTKELRVVIDDVFTIKSTLFRVNQIGEISIVIELNEFPGRYFNPSLFIAIRTDGMNSVELTDDSKTLNNLIKENNNLSAENSYLKNILNHSLNGNF